MLRCDATREYFFQNCLGGMKRMVRLPAAVLITCCLVAQLSAQASKEQTVKEQSSKEQEPAAPTAAAPSAKTQFPLDAFQEFSAIMVGSVSVGDDRESHIYRSGKLLRNEGPEKMGYFITDLSTLEMFGVSAGPCIHDSHPHFRAAPFALIKPGYTVERAAAGEETVDGHACKIEDVTLTAKKLPTPIKLRFWEAEDLQGFPVKVEFRRSTAKNSVIHYKNVILGPQDPTLFIYPRECQPSPSGPDTIRSKPASKYKKPAAAAPPATPPH